MCKGCAVKRRNVQGRAPVASERSGVSTIDIMTGGDSYDDPHVATNNGIKIYNRVVDFEAHELEGGDI